MCYSDYDDNVFTRGSPKAEVNTLVRSWIPSHFPPLVSSCNFESAIIFNFLFAIFHYKSNKIIQILFESFRRMQSKDDVSSFFLATTNINIVSANN